MSEIEPKQPSGVRDYPPAEMIPRMRIINTVRSVFDRFGFDPLETPSMERRCVLTGNDPNFRMLIYNAVVTTGIDEEAAEIEADIADDEDSSMMTALRFDLTVPLARFVAANPDLPRPFKRYQIGNVYRGEKPQKGRFREFMQFDADIVGASSVQADVEIIWIIYEVLTALDVGKFTIRINNRKILNGLPEYVGFKSSEIVRVMQSIDKIDKIGWQAVAKDLQVSKKEFLDSPELTQEQCDKLRSFVELTAENSELMISSAKKLLKGIQVSQEGLDELCEIANSLNNLGIPQEFWKIDLSVARGLGYYTGPVFEAVLDDRPKMGSVFSGGRFDGLVSRFSNLRVPSTGASIGIDRLFAALQDQGKIEIKGSNTQALIFVLDKNYTQTYNALAKELREADIRTGVYFGDDPAFKAQLVYALKLGVPLAIIIGGDEVAKNTVSIKDLRTKKQISVPRNELLRRVKDLL